MYMDPEKGGLAESRKWWRRTAGSPAFRLAALAFVVYQLNLRSISSADTFPLRYIPISILTEGNFDLDEFRFLRDQPDTTSPVQSGLPYYLQYYRGHYVSTPPIAVAILATPLYALPVWLGLTGDPSAPRPLGGAFTRTEVMGTLLSKLAASLMIAISVALVYLALRNLLDASGSLWITLAYAFATSSWAVSSQGLWQTTGSQMLLAGAFLALLIAQRRRTREMVVLAGVLAALGVMCRPTTLIFAVLLTLYVWHAHREHLLAYLPIPSVLAVLLLGYNLYYFGVLKGGYEGVHVEQLISWKQVSTALQGLLVSPNRGILTFSPVVLPAFAGMVVAFRRGGPLLLRYLACGVLLTIAFYSTLPQWHGQFSFSYRYLVDLLPALALLAVPTWGWIVARSWRRQAIGALAVFSLFIQVVGVLYYPCGWYRSTQHDPAAMARFFDWGNLEVVQCLRAGPVDPDGLRLIRGLFHRNPSR